MNSSLRSANNLTKVIVAKGASAHGLADGVSVAGGLADGIVAVVTPDLKVISLTGELTNTAIAAGGYFQIVQGTGVGEPLIMSPILSSTSYTISRSKFKAATEQITYIGYNGTTGAIDADTASTSYVITLVMTNPNEKDRSQPTRVYGQYTTAATGATHAYSTEQLVGSLTKNFSVKSDKVKIEMVISDAASNTAFGGGSNATGNVTFTKGSKTATMTDTQDLSANDWFRVSASATETLTDAAYKIASVDSATTITLSTEYAGETETIDDDFIHLVGATPGDMGIRLTGIAREFDVTSKRNYYKTRFVVSLSEAFLSTGVTTSQNAFEGVGTPNQVAMDYYESMGFQGQHIDTIGVPPVARLSVPTAVTGEYGVMELSLDNAVSSIVSQSSLKSSLIVYLEYATSGGDVAANGEEIISTSTAYDA